MSWRRIASIATGIVGVAIAVYLVASDDTAIDALSRVAIWTLAAVLGVQVVNVVTDSVRYWMVLPARFRAPLPLWRWHHIFSVGRLLNLIVPQAGAAYRAARLKLGHGVPVSTYFGSVVAITWLGNGVALLAAALAVTVYGEAVAGLLIAGAGVVILAAIWALPRLPWFSEGRAPSWFSDRAVAIVRNFGEAFRELGAKGGRLGPVLGVSIVSQLAGLTAYVLAVAALGADRPVVVGSVIYTATTIATVVSLSPGGLGITELTAGLAGAALDFGSGSAVLAAFIIRVTGIASVAGLALISGLLTETAPPTPASRDG